MNGKTAVLVASRNRPDLVEQFANWLGRNVRVPHDLFVVECGSDPERISPHATLAYEDPDFLGKCFGHRLLVQQARSAGPYDHYWVLMNDLVFPDGEDALARLIETLEREPRMAVLSPTERGSDYPEGEPRPEGGWHAAATCDYLGFLMRGSALEEVGFLNPVFRYCWGAIHELSYQLHRRDWFLAYSDDVSYRHLGRIDLRRSRHPNDLPRGVQTPRAPFRAPVLPPRLWPRLGQPILASRPTFRRDLRHLLLSPALLGHGVQCHGTQTAPGRVRRSPRRGEYRARGS